MSVARVEAHDGRSSHWWQPQIAVLLLAVSLLVSCGCAMGPRALRFNRQKYNESVTRTNREELLLNLVRLRYGDTPEVLPCGSVTTQLSWDYSANASGAAAEDLCSAGPSRRSGIFACIDASDWKLSHSSR